MLKREKYLSKMRDFYDKDLIKVITGIRRSGKSVLLRQIIDEVKETGIRDDHIIYINFEDIKNNMIDDYLKLNDFITSKIVDNDKYYLFFDEIQLIEKWEIDVND